MCGNLNRDIAESSAACLHSQKNPLSQLRLFHVTCFSPSSSCLSIQESRTEPAIDYHAGSPPPAPDPFPTSAYQDGAAYLLSSKPGAEASASMPRFVAFDALHGPYQALLRLLGVANAKQRKAGSVG